MHSFDYHDWNKLAIEDDLSAYFPPSPLREPFRSLFASAPDQALRLLAELSNHSMTAWRQLHALAQDSPGTPIALEIDFPWGNQRFWGGDREYLWCRSTWAPHPIGCGYLALEEWALAELEHGRSADDLLQQVVTGNECIAVLGGAVAIALQANAVSETVFALVRSQRLLDADHNRMVQDYTSANDHLIGFRSHADFKHVEAIKKANSRPGRRRDLTWLIPLFFFSTTFKERTRAAIVGFTSELPFQIEQHRAVPAAQEHLRQRALEYAELVESQHYRHVPSPAGDGRDAIVHVSPTATSPQRIARAQQAGVRLQEANLWAWGAKYFESGQLGDGFTPHSAIEFAQSVDDPTVFERSSDDSGSTDMRRGAIAATAAVALDRPEGLSSMELTWAREVLGRITNAPEKRNDDWSPQATIPWHPAIFVARGLAADLRNGTGAATATQELIALVAHPLEKVSLAALEAALSLWAQDPKLGWSALHVALSLCVLTPSNPPRGPRDAMHSSERVRTAVEEAIRIYSKEEAWTDLPLPPAPWVKIERTEQAVAVWDEFDALPDPADFVDPSEQQAPSPTHWYGQYAAQVVKRIPFKEVLRNTAKAKFLDLLSGLLAWTISKISPPWARQDRQSGSGTRLFEWMNALGEILGSSSGFCTFAEVETRFLAPIVGLKDDHCWELLAPFADVYICVHIYDAEDVPTDANEHLRRCLDRFLQSPAFDPKAHRSGELPGSDQPRMARALMFVGLDEPARGATRYANGDWSDIARVLPVVDRFVRSAGWVSTIMSHFLTLCERARDAYPAEDFADQILHVMDGSGPALKGWHGTLLAARIAGLVQHLADRETPTPPALGQKLLRILDLLVDMGDRRSAALQLSESFREIQTGAAPK